MSTIVIGAILIAVVVIGILIYLIKKPKPSSITGNSSSSGKTLILDS